ncbi:MAG: carbohydrate-binding domain-containing protein, partial [Anaerolineae bacterium]|nr:carbohydrate-binding domain-containing protein [Anaerolineae bacterium]
LGILLAGVLAFGSFGLAAAQDSVTAIDLGTLSGNVVTIDAAGTYQISGTLADGQIVVAAPADSAVTLILDGINLGSSTSAPIQITSAASVTLSLADGTQNTIRLDAAYTETSAAVVTSADLIIAGTGSLTIDSPSNDGIQGAASLTIADAPTLTITAGDDAIRVEGNVTIDNGTLNLVAGGGSSAALSEDLSGKGIRAEQSITINNGTIAVDAADDAIRTEQDLTVNAGTITISATGKALHGTYNVVINSGVITILASDEGIEGGWITIYDGQIDITASDDGINISEPDDIANPDLYFLYIYGGTIYVNADGDGIDSNGSIEMTGGVVVVNGPTGSDNGAIDYDGTFTISGGLLVAAGSAGMPSAPSMSGGPGMMMGGGGPGMREGEGMPEGMTPPDGAQRPEGDEMPAPPDGAEMPAGADMAAVAETDSTQASVLIVFDSEYPAGTVVSIQSSDGDQLLTFAPEKAFQSLVFSSPELAQGESYVVYVGGSSDGTAVNGLYADGTYNGGAEQAAFTVNGMLTQVGSARGMRMGG